LLRFAHPFGAAIRQAVSASLRLRAECSNQLVPKALPWAVSSADILPNEKENTLTVRIHRMACPAHDKAISSLLADLTKAGFHHPQTGARMVNKLT